VHACVLALICALGGTGASSIALGGPAAEPVSNHGRACVPGVVCAPSVATAAAALITGSVRLPLPTGLVPTHFAPITPIVRPSVRPRVSRGVRVSSVSGGNPGLDHLGLERPSPPMPVGPLPAPVPARRTIVAPGGGSHASATSTRRGDLTVLVWVSFFAAALVAGAAGIVHRVRTRPSGTTVFGRPTHEIDRWLASAELAATTTPPPVDTGPPDAAPGDGSDPTGDSGDDDRSDGPAPGRIPG
jgi:hypothetical protein